jgi:hypothetical protein
VTTSTATAETALAAEDRSVDIDTAMLVDRRLGDG